MTRAARLSVLAMILTATAVLGGCGTITSADIRSDPTPELYSQALTRTQFRNDRAIHQHHAWRTARDDWARIWMYDKNTQLTPLPTP